MARRCIYQDGSNSYYWQSKGSFRTNVVAIRSIQGSGFVLGKPLSHVLRNAVFVDVFNKRLKWLSTNNLNFLPCLLIKPTLYNFPNSGESPRSVDDAELAELLRIIILCNLWCFLDEAVYSGVHRGYRKATQIRNSKRMADLLLSNDWARQMYQLNLLLITLHNALPKVLITNNLEYFCQFN